MRKLCLLAVALAATLLPQSAESFRARTWPYEQDSFDAVLNSPKKVWAHYVPNQPLQLDAPAQPCYSDYYSVNYLAPGGEGKTHIAAGGWQRVAPACTPVGSATTYRVDNMATEFRQMIAVGINGVALNLFSTQEWSTNGGPGGGKGWLFIAMDAAYKADPRGRFKILLMPDITSGVTPTQIVAMMTTAVPGTAYTIYNHPLVYHYPDANNRVQLSPYGVGAASQSAYQTMITSLNSQSTPISWGPVFGGLGAADVAAYNAIPTVIAMQWGPGGGYADQLDTPARDMGTIATGLTWANGSAKWAAPIVPQYWFVGDSQATNTTFEAGGTLLFRNNWTASIARSEMDQAMIVTWNDNIENTGVSPARGAFGERQTGFYRLVGYYTQWWRSGAAPPISRDAIVYAHRKVSTTAPKTFASNTWTFGGSNAAAQTIEMLAFLPTSATMKLSLNGTQLNTCAVAAGLQRCTTTIPAGTGALGQPLFEVVRNGVTNLSYQSNATIYGSDGIPAQSMPGLADGGACGYNPCWPALNVDWTYYTGASW